MAMIGWKCEVCKSEIADQEGVLHVPMSAVQAHQDAAEGWREKYPGSGHSMAELSEYPERVHWRAVHDSCDADPEPYLIEVERIRTPWHLVWWSAHLLEKTWIKTTDWGEVLRQKHATSGEVAP